MLGTGGLNWYYVFWFCTLDFPSFPLFSLLKKIPGKIPDKISGSFLGRLLGHVFSSFLGRLLGHFPPPAPPGPPRSAFSPCRSLRPHLGWHANQATCQTKLNFKKIAPNSFCSRSDANLNCSEGSTEGQGGPRSEILVLFQTLDMC